MLRAFFIPKIKVSNLFCTGKEEKMEELTPREGYNLFMREYLKKRRERMTEEEKKEFYKKQYQRRKRKKKEKIL